MKTICVDFDGVIHSYTSGWQGADKATDRDVDGAITWLVHMIQSGYTIAIFSARSSQPGGIEAMKDFLDRKGLIPEYIEKIQFPTTKPPAFLTIDDRAICFRGTFPSRQEIENFRTWNEHLKERK